MSEKETARRLWEEIEQFSEAVKTAIENEDDARSREILEEAIDEASGGLKTLYIYFRTEEKKK